MWSTFIPTVTAKPEGSICLIVKKADTGFWLCTTACFAATRRAKPEGRNRLLFK